VRNQTLEEQSATFLFVIWNILLVPWMALAPLLAMAFDAPPTLSVYLGVWSVWSYPLSVGVVWMFRKKHHLIILFPCVNLLVFVIASNIP
jgi:hypothetical protein